jgi:hypothetical protein
MRVFPLVILLLAALAPNASAQWRKLTVAAHMNDSVLPLSALGPVPNGTWDFASAAGSFTFSTTAGPVEVTGTTVEFAVADHEFSATTMVGARGAERFELNPTNSSATIVYNASNDSLAFTLTGEGVGGEALDMTFTIVDPVGDFSLGMTSMPTAGYVANGSVFSLLHASGDAFQAIYLRPNNVFAVGAVQYSAGAASAPAPRPCNAADLAAPFGILNFFDLTSYLNILQQGCP